MSSAMRPRRWRSLLEAGLRLGGALVQVLSAIVVARCVSAAMAGTYFVGLTVATIVAVVCRAGFDQALTRVVAADYALGRPRAAQATCGDLMRVFLRRIAWVCPVLIVAALAATWWPIPGVDAQLARALLPFLFAAPLFGVAVLSGVALQAAGRPLLSVSSLFFIHNGFVIGAALLPSALREAGAFNLAFLIGCAVAATIGALALRQTLRAKVVASSHAATGLEIADAARRQEVRALARENAGTVIGNLALVWGPLSLLGLLSSPVEAARFGIASRCAQLVSFALPALNFVLAPRFAALRATHQRTALRRIFVGSMLLSLALSSVVALPMMAMAAPIMAFFGPEYAASAVVLVLLALAQWANGASGAAIQFLAMTGGEKPLRRIFVLTASLALLAGVGLVWRAGALGAAVLALGSFLILNLLCTVAAVRQLRRVEAETATHAVADAPRERNGP